MAVTSGFFNSLNGDRRYNAEQMSEIFNGIINDGVFSSVGTAFAVTASEGNTITIGIGRGWFNSAWIYNDAILPLTLSNSETLLDRIDAVVIEINHSIGVRSGSIKVVNGTPATTPENPTLVNIDNVHQYPLAYIYRAAGSTSIVQANITNKVGTSDCPYVTGILEVQNIDNIVAQWQSEFDIWFANLEDSLSGDVAVKLANDILALQSQFEDLALYKTVYVELEDSQDNTIQDSNGNPIYGATTFGDSNTEGGSSGQPVVVSESPYKPGDTLTTARNDLDESWLLCNGAEITRTDYPQLAAQFPPKPTDPYLANVIYETGSSGASYGYYGTVYNIIYANGYYVCVGEHHTDDPQGPMYGSDRTFKLAYSTSLSGPWSEVALTSYFINYVYRVKYVNGYYVVVGRSSSGATLIYTQSLGGSWTTVTLDEPFDIITDIAYGGGYYVVTGNGMSGFRGDYVEENIAYSTALNGTWTQYSMRENNNEGDGPYCWCVEYINNQFVVGSSVLGADPVLYYGNPGSSWNTVTLADTNFGQVVHKVAYLNGYYVLTAAYNYVSASTFPSQQPDSYEPYIAYTQTLGSSTAWTYVELPVCCSTVLYNEQAGYYVAFGYTGNDATTVTPTDTTAAVAYATDLAGPWTMAAVSNQSLAAILNDALIEGEQYVAAGAGTDGGSIVYSNLETFTLPSISLSDKTYTYIKAKED